MREWSIIQCGANFAYRCISEHSPHMHTSFGRTSIITSSSSLFSYIKPSKSTPQTPFDHATRTDLDTYNASPPKSPVYSNKYPGPIYSDFGIIIDYI